MLVLLLPSDCHPEATNPASGLRQGDWGEIPPPLGGNPSLLRLNRPREQRAALHLLNAGRADGRAMPESSLRAVSVCRTFLWHVAFVFHSQMVLLE